MKTAPRDHPDKPRVAISACLLGIEVRYDGGHKRDPVCADELAGKLELIAVCPEVEAGLGTPRPPIHIRLIDGQPRLTNTGEPGSDIATDVTTDIREVAAHRAAELDDICGFIFKQRSPSCGLRQVALADTDGQPLPRYGRGLFASRITELRPLLPLTDEGLLEDPGERARFLQRVQVLQRWHGLDPHDPTALREFHDAQRAILNTRGHQHLAHIIANTGNGKRTDYRAHYIRELMRLLGPNIRRDPRLGV